MAPHAFWNLAKVTVGYLDCLRQHMGRNRLLHNSRRTRPSLERRHLKSATEDRLVDPRLHRRLESGNEVHPVWPVPDQDRHSNRHRRLIVANADDVYRLEIGHVPGRILFRAARFHHRGWVTLDLALQFVAAAAGSLLDNHRLLIPEVASVVS